MNADHTEKEMHGFRCIVAYDEDPQDPGEWGYADYFLGDLQTGRVRFGHPDWGKEEARRYLPYGQGPWEWSEDGNGRFGLDRDTWFDDEADMRLVWEAEMQFGYEVFPVEYLDHGGGGGSSIRHCDDEDADGFIFIKVPWKSELERLAHPDHDSDKLADGIVEEWNTYLSGDIHWARIEDSDGETLESCGNFYGWQAAEEWLEETAEGLKDDTRPVTVLVVHGSLALPFPCDVAGKVLSIEVPLRIGASDIGQWATTEGPFKDDPDVLQVETYNGPCPCENCQSDVVKAVMNG